MNYLGIDYGERKVGLAYASQEMPMAFPYDVIVYTKESDLINELIRICEKEHVDVIIVGCPNTQVGGKDNIWQKKVKDFIQLLKEKTNKEVISADERFSSAMAKKVQKELPKKMQGDDDVAAAIILQGYLDRIKQL